MSEEGNDTVVRSSVTFAPVPEDDGTFLKCLGDNPKLPGYSQEDSFKLNVVCEYTSLNMPYRYPEDVFSVLNYPGILDPNYALKYNSIKNHASHNKPSRE